MCPWSLSGALVSATPEHFVCDNCGEPWWILAVSIVSVMIALLAAVFAWRSDKNSSAMLTMMRTEHRAFLEASGRRPDLAIDIHWKNGGDEIDVTGATLTYARLIVGVRNNGNLIARGATMNLLLPRGDFAKSKMISSDDAKLNDTSELLEDGGPGTAAMYYSLSDLKFPPNVSQIIEVEVQLTNYTRLIPVKVTVVDENGDGWQIGTQLRVKGKPGP